MREKTLYMSWAGFEPAILLFEWKAQRNFRDLCDPYDLLRTGRVARKGEDV